MKRKKIDDVRTTDNRSEGRHEHPLPGETSRTQRKLNESAHDQAVHDMIDDAELVASNKNDDLDEGETARLDDDKNPII